MKRSRTGAAPRQGIVFMALALAALLANGCYDTPQPACGFTCGSGGACPEDYVCGQGNRCRLSSTPEDQCGEELGDAMPADATPIN